MLELHGWGVGAATRAIQQLHSNTRALSVQHNNHDSGSPSKGPDIHSNVPKLHIKYRQSEANSMPVQRIWSTGMEMEWLLANCEDPEWNDAAQAVEQLELTAKLLNRRTVQHTST